MSEIKKTVEIRVSISTDPRVSHIGRYFIDIRDTTNGANRQMTTKVAPAEEVPVFIGQVEGHAARAGVTTTVVNETGGELEL